MITCIRTGCQVYLTQTGEYLWGDAFEGPDFFVFNVVGKSYSPLNVPVRHFTVQHIDHWWNERSTSSSAPSVLLAFKANSTNHGYDGVPDEFLRNDGTQRINP